jgi:hypothetical protein
VVGTAESGDAFGAAVIAGDFNQSEGLDSLAIGALARTSAPWAPRAPSTSATPRRARRRRRSVLLPGGGGLGGVAKSVDQFGAALS